MYRKIILDDYKVANNSLPCTVFSKGNVSLKIPY